MTGVLAIGHIFRLGVGMLMLAGMTACDDAPETPTPKSSEVKGELMRKRLAQKASESIPLTVQNFEMRESGQTVTLSVADNFNTKNGFTRSWCRNEMKLGIIKIVLDST